MPEIRTRLLGGVFFITAATLCLQVSLTRYFSISQNYHFAFLVISIAFLGFGASGSFLSLFQRARNMNPGIFLASGSLFFSLAVMASFFICNAIPFDFHRLSWDRSQIPLIFLYYPILAVPFFFAGLTVSFAVTRFSSVVNKIYFSDLLGAGTGSFLATLIFLPAGERGVFVSISLLGLVSAFLFCPGSRAFMKLTVLILIAAAVLLVFLAPPWLGFRISPFKALPVALKYPEAKHLFTRWDAVSRVDILDTPAVRYAPGLSLLYQDEIPRQLGLSIDGGELSAVTSFMSASDEKLEFFRYLPSSLAYTLAPGGKTLVIEPRGGLDVLSALYFGATSVRVIESYSLVPDILRRELASFSGHLYDRKEVILEAGTPRGVLLRGKETYDLIVFSLTDVFGSSGTGLYGFGENYLFTVESMVHLLDRLSPGGVISLSLYLLPPPRKEIKLLATWIEALEKKGKNPASHIMAIRSWGTMSYFIKENPFDGRDQENLKSFAGERLFDLVHYPGIKEEETNIHNQFDRPLYFELAAGLMDRREREELYRNYLFDIRPVTDNRPFFDNDYKWSRMKSTYKALGSRLLPFLQGEYVIPLLLLQAVAIASLLILFPRLVMLRSLPGKKRVSSLVFGYFGLIGTAFMFVEITLIQKFILFLGHPLFSLSVILFSLLLSSGLGSYFSKRILGDNFRRHLPKALAGCAVLISGYLLFLPIFCEKFIAVDFPQKIFLTFLAVFPLGFLMGFPFPTGIRLLAASADRLIPWAWATNAFSSVAGSILALMLAFRGGYNFVLMLAAGCYLLTLLFLGFADHGDKTDA